RIMLYIPSLFKINIWKQLPFIITGTGLFLFILGTIAWFYAKILKKTVADFWIYRISRHPQYLGWIIWSYGVMFLPGNNMKLSFDISNSLPWLISTMIIIGVAMSEEMKMRSEHGEKYTAFTRRTPFLFPMPAIVSNIIAAPMRFLLKKEHPERKREIASVLMLYTTVCILLSLIYGNIDSIASLKEQFIKKDIKQQIGELTFELKNSERREAHRYAMALAEIGEPSVDTLIDLLKDDNDFVREFSAQALGRIKSPRSTQALLEALNDDHWRVRATATNALGEIKSKQAIQSLLEATNSDNEQVRYAAVSALGKIGTEEAIDPIIDLMQESEGYTLISHINALGRIGSEKALKPLVKLLNNEDENARRAAVLALMKINSPKAVQPLIDALKDEDWEVRLYAVEALEQIGTPEAINALMEYKK
ncbi:HEAT repeat domain-containing protein, partial [Candidatus Latescibacterota bacterium]